MFMPSFVEATAEQKSSIESTATLALASPTMYLASLTNLPVIERFCMKEFVSTARGDIVHESLVAVFATGSAGASLSEKIMQALTIYKVSEYLELPIGGDHELPLVAIASTKDGVNGLPLAAEGQEVVVFIAPERLLVVRPKGPFSSVLAEIKQAKIKLDKAKVADQQDSAPRRKRYYVLDMDGNQFIGHEPGATLQTKMRETTLIRRLLTPTQQEALLIDSQLDKARVATLKGLASSGSNGSFSLAARAFPSADQLSQLRQCGVMLHKNKFEQLLAGDWRNICLENSVGPRLQDFTEQDLSAIEANKATKKGREAISSAIVGFLLYLEAITGIEVLSTPLGKTAREIAYKSAWDKFEDLYILHLLEKVMYNWHMNISTVKISAVEGYVAPEGDQTSAQAWLDFLGYLVAGTMKDTEPRPHHTFQDSIELKNLLAVEKNAIGKRRLSAREEKSESEEEDGGSEEEAQVGPDTKRSGKKQDRGQKKPLCIAHLAFLFEVKDSTGQAFSCSFGSGCHFHHPDGRKNAGTKLELLHIVKHSGASNTVLVDLLTEAIEATTDLYK
jgi:hypothetical protein